MDIISASLIYARLQVSSCMQAFVRPLKSSADC